MRPRLLLPVAAIAVLLAAAPSAAVAVDFVPGEVVVGYKAEASASMRAAAGSATGTGHAEKVSGAHRVKIRDGESVAETVQELRRQPGVKYAVPNYIARADSFIPNDPGFDSPGGWTQLQWNFFGPAGVNAPDAWDFAIRAGAPGGNGAVVAVLDTGVAYSNRGRFR